MAAYLPRLCVLPRPATSLLVLCLIGFDHTALPCRQHLPNGQISNVVGGKCIGADGIAVVLTACDGASIWETQSNGKVCFVHIHLVDLHFDCMRAEAS